MLTKPQAKKFLASFDLEGLIEGEPVRLHHGTTAAFSEFDVRRGGRAGKIRASAVFLTPKKSAAWSFSYGARNAGLDPEIVEDLERINPKAGAFLRRVVRYGGRVWDVVTPERLGVQPGGEYSEALTRYVGGVDPNDLVDIADHVRGSRSRQPVDAEEASRQAIFSLMTGESAGTPPWIYKRIAALGLDPRRYGPKVLTVVATPRKVGVTSSKREVRHAPAHGYDAVVYAGDDVEEGVPEVVSFDPAHLKIERVEYGVDTDEDGMVRGRARRLTRR